MKTTTLHRTDDSHATIRSIAIPVVLAPGIALLPSAGVTVAGAGGTDGGAALFGYNVGGAAVFGSGPIRFRAGVTWHALESLQPQVLLVELGLVHLSLP